MTLAETIGRWHLAVLHLPIGLLFFAAVALVFRQKVARSAVEFSVALAAATAVLASATGFLLHLGAGFDETEMGFHAFSAYATATVSVAAFFARRSRFFEPLVFLAAVLVAATGHFGGALTHGAGFLFSNSESGLRNSDFAEATSTGAASTVFESEIRPIFLKKCAACHGPTKQKGGLRLDSEAFLKLGSERGDVLFAPKTGEKSRLLEVISLPENHDDRMPPRGKTQLEKAEFEALKNWLEAGADFLKKAEKTAPALPFFPPVEVEKADEKALVEIQKRGIAAISKLGENTNWLAVSLVGKKKPSAENWAFLAKIGLQTTHFDASGAGFSDADASRLADAMPNLTRLNFSKNAISDASAEAFSSLRFLQNLNLTGCSVGDDFLKTLAEKGPAALEKIALWQTRATASGIDFLRQKRPALEVETGLVSGLDSLPSLRLLPPKILFARSIFDDTLEVKLDFGMPGIGLFYDFDEASPTTQSPKFDGKPIILDRTARLRAIAARDGWQASEPSEVIFVKRKHRAVSARLLRPPSKDHPSTGASALIDGVLGEIFYEKPFLAWQGEHLDAVLDFGKPIRFERMNVHFGQATLSWVHAPAGLQVWASDDEKTWRPVLSRHYPTPGPESILRVDVLTEAADAPVEARFLKVRVENRLKNPAWHGSPGEPCWVFVDEIFVE